MPDGSHQTNAPKSPQKLWPLFVAGALIGLLARACFVYLETAKQWQGVMMSAFVVATPFVIGAWTVYQLPNSTRNFWTSVWAPWWPMILMCFGAGLALIEGSICIAMALPIFCFCASLGGVLMYAVMVTFKLGHDQRAHALLVLPLVFGAVESGLPLPNQWLTATSTVYIESAPDFVWDSIVNVAEIAEPEWQASLAHRIGVPRPHAAKTEQASGGERTRTVAWLKSVHFAEPIIDWQPPHRLSWRYQFSANSFPTDALDPHVLIGGRHFDLSESSFELVAAGKGTQLTLTTTFRVSTGFNWYAAPIGRWLVQDTQDALLGFYKRRNEQARQVVEK